MPSNIIIFPSNLVPQPLRRPNIVFEYTTLNMKLEVLFAAGIQIFNQLLVAPQTGCINYEIFGATNPSCTVQYTDCNTGVVTQLVVPFAEYRYRCARNGSISDISGVSITQSLGACYPKVQIYSGLTVNNFLSVGGVQVLNGTGDWIGPGTNITGAQGAQGPQ